MKTAIEVLDAFEDIRRAQELIAGKHTRGKIVLRVAE